MAFTLKEELDFEGMIFMYTGNMEGYQGIDLLLKSFQKVIQHQTPTALVLIGGYPSDIEKYQKKSERLNLTGNVYFLGDKPKDCMNHYLQQADILVSPRIKGRNTPMKIFSYLHSEKAVLATKIATHTQLLNDNISVLANPNPQEFSEAMEKLIDDKLLRQKLGNAGRRFIEGSYTYSEFKEKVNKIREWVKPQLDQSKI